MLGSIKSSLHTGSALLAAAVALLHHIGLQWCTMAATHRPLISAAPASLLCCSSLRLSFLDLASSSLIFSFSWLIVWSCCSIVACCSAACNTIAQQSMSQSQCGTDSIYCGLQYLRLHLHQLCSHAMQAFEQVVVHCAVHCAVLL
jgi:hypothetical protein